MATQKPDAHVRIGNVEAAIWRNENGDRVWYNVTFKRHYTEGDVWKSTESFRRDDLLVLAKVADNAHTLILELQHEEGDASNDV
jgi:hypothetical protein